MPLVQAAWFRVQRHFSRLEWIGNAPSISVVLILFLKDLFDRFLERPGKPV